jgi:hypothetical protein
MYLNNMKNKSNAMDKIMCAVMIGITYTIYKKIQIYISYLREDPADSYALPNIPTSQISLPPKPPNLSDLPKITNLPT